MSLNKFIEVINKPLEKLLSGIKVYGIAESIARTKGSEIDILPGIVSNDGEIEYVGVDDVETVIVYHKVNAIGSRLATIKGYGDDQNAFQNTYSMSMVVYINRKNAKIRPEKLFLFIQANIPFLITQEPYVLIQVPINTVILNSQTVYDSEYRYQSKKPLPKEHSLMQINYTIESTFHQNCFEKCPEDC